MLFICLFNLYQKIYRFLKAAEHREPSSSKLSDITMKHSVLSKHTKYAMRSPAGSNYPLIIRVRGDEPPTPSPPLVDNVFLLHLILRFCFLFLSYFLRPFHSYLINRARRRLRLEIRDAISKHSIRAPLYY